MPFDGILFPTEHAHAKAGADRPDYFVDLGLDQIIGAVTNGYDEYDLKPLFYQLPHDPATIAYRHQVMKNLEDAPVAKCVGNFVQAMRASRERVGFAEKMHDTHQRHAFLLHAVADYCRTVKALTADLHEVGLTADGLLALRDYLDEYCDGDGFQKILEEADSIVSDLDAILYTVLIKNDTVSVHKLENQVDYEAEIEDVFAKFRQGDVETRNFKFTDYVEMNHVESQILEGVASLFPEVFQRMARFCGQHKAFVDKTVGRFDREINFYLSYLEFIAGFRRRGLAFCYPQLSVEDKAESVEETFDLALAKSLLSEREDVVCNDFHLEGEERLFVVTGPNQGGKTTFARTFGQLHHLAGLGCPVPGKQARLLLCDAIFTHFEREEALSTLRGKLHDDLVRIHDILEKATSKSVIILNEIFNSTALEDAVFLARRVLERIIEIDAPGVCVTFMDELASLAPQTVSMSSTVVPDNPAERTFKIVRKQADGLAFALSVAQKYRVTHDAIMERLQS